ncbi:hypothetical protein [Sporosarcina sp. FSL K6-5500]|uniref:hypothetical protein n=1 Tax=Sporosarcina sp. FSL K6-5500 TaxID=2921558 RepID=UPI0030F7F358
MTLSASSNVTTGSIGSPGTAAVKVVTVPHGTSLAGSATLSFNDGDGIDEDIPVTITGQNSNSSSSPDGVVIKDALSNKATINAKYIIGAGTFNADEISITQRNNTGDVTISVTLNPVSPVLSMGSRTTGVAAVLGIKDKDKFTVTNVATSNGSIIVRISDDTGLGNTDVTVSGIATTDTKAQIATKIANALTANSAIGTKYTVTASGDDVELEKQLPGANSVTVGLQN